MTSPRLLFAALAALTVAVYWPSLHGGYLFDDAFYFVDNPTVHVTTLRFGDWLNAALSQAGFTQFRALSMLSFAANYYFTGTDPFWVKLTNLAIHIGNGLLLFGLLREALRLRALVRALPPAKTDAICAAVIAGAWLLLPINLTDVAYVSQRMESLANLFVLAGLWAYLRARCGDFVGERRGVRLWIAMLGGLALGFSAKESAALLPLYTACAEFALTGFRNRDGRLSRPALAIHALLLILPLIAGLAWISTWVFHSIANVRSFSIGERLLTEPRVLVDYLRWTLLPNLGELTFFHDDFAVSHGLLDPPATLPAIAALAALFGAALWQRTARPLLCLGVLWFFAGHAMTATVIPLELVFEHRNYFSSAGLLLAAAALLALEPGLPRRSAQAIIAAGFIALFAFTTLLRAQEWSNPLRLAYAEALKRPASPRAQYELARTLVAVAGRDDASPLIGESIKLLEREAQRPDSGIAPLQALIYLNGRAHREIPAAWWESIREKLRAGAPSQTDIESVIALYRCQVRGECPRQTAELLGVFTDALAASQGNVLLTSVYAEFAVSELHDTVLAERLMRDCVAARPTAPAYRVDLIQLLIATGQFEAAETAIAELAPLNHLGSLDPVIVGLRLSLQRTRAAAAQQTAPQNR